MRSRACIGLILLLLFAVTWNLQYLTSNLRRWPLLFEHWGIGPQYLYVDGVTAYERRFDSIRNQVAAYSVVGYRIVASDATRSAPQGDNAWRHFIANYTLTPTVLDSESKYPVTVVDPYSGPVRLRRRR
jgi:hypothetical protein